MERDDLARAFILPLNRGGTKEGRSLLGALSWAIVEAVNGTYPESIEWVEEVSRDQKVWMPSYGK